MALFLDVINRALSANQRAVMSQHKNIFNLFLYFSYFSFLHSFFQGNYGPAEFRRIYAILFMMGKISGNVWIRVD